MKICKRLLYGSLALLTILLANPSTGQQIGDTVHQFGGIQPGMADVNLGWPGRVWTGVTLADQGLGYQGSYVTLGAKTHAFQDYFDGRWLVEARGHYSLNADDGGFFANIGLERVFSLEAAEAELTASVWYDYDGDQQGNFSRAYNSVGISGGIKKRRWELLANGYLPVGTATDTQGDPTGLNCFLGNSIVTQAGITSALRGFDAIIECNPRALEQINGSFGVGGYSYGSDIVDYFGGVRGQFGMQFMRGMILNLQINHDNRFDVTGVLQMAWIFGAGARGTEYGILGNDLEPTVRNDHIVRFQQELRLAIDPDTGRPYNVYHVDNLADPGLADGTFETAFTSLADAEAASSTDDIIFVREGDGTTRNMDMGIALQDGQLLLGDGVRHLIPLADGTRFVLCNDRDGNLPTITNRAGGNAIDLASRNTVRGFIIDGSQGGMINGISGDGTPLNPLTGGIIEDVTITGNPILNGIFLDDIAGNWRFARNEINTASFDGIFISDACDPTSVFDFEDNVVNNNGRDGIHIEDYDGSAFRFVDNVTSGNGRDGIRMERFKNGSGAGASLEFINPLAGVIPDPNNPGQFIPLGNLGNGIHIDDFVGNVRFLNSNISNNLNHGISLVDVRTPGINDMVFIGTSGPGTSIINNNGVGTGAGIFNELNTAFGVERLLVTNTTLDNGGTGIVSSATAIGANLRTDILDNLSISGNQSDGIRLMSSGGATHTGSIVNAQAALFMTGNAGNGISMFASDPGSTSLLEVDTDNVAITASGVNGMLFNSTDDGQIISRTRNTMIAGAGLDGAQINADNLNSAAVNEFHFSNTTISGVVDDGIDINVGDQTFVDFSLTSSTLNNGNIGNQGIEASVTGDALAVVDSRLRMSVVGSTINAFDTGDGIDISSFGDAHVLAEIASNTITNNGANVTNMNMLPFGDGINIVAAGDSEQYLRILNNNVTANAEQGLDITTVGNGQVSALVDGNFLAGNDTQDDGSTIPPENGIADITVTNDVTGQICLAMSTNFFTLPAFITNNSGAANFELELDGLTNGPAPIITVGVFTVNPFPTNCAMNINIEETAFNLNGFAPWP